MGTIISNNNNESEDVDQVNLSLVRSFVRSTYIVGIVIWTIMWLCFLTQPIFVNHPILWIGYVFPIVYLVANAIISSKNETIGTYGAERAEIDRLERNAFYTVAGLFALGSLLSSLMTRLNSNLVMIVSPFLILVIFFVICVSMAPLWMSTVDPIQTIKYKHVKTVMITYGSGFMVTALAILFTEMVKQSKLGHGVDCKVCASTCASTCPSTTSSISTTTPTT